MSISEYQEKIEFWAETRGLNKPEYADRQASKVIEELGEFAGNFVRGRCVKDDIGDIFVTIVILAKQKGIQIDFGKTSGEGELYLGDPIRIYQLIGFLVSSRSNFGFKKIANEAMREILTFCINNDISFLECIEIAWNEIKLRKGRMVNGTFVKEADLVS